jgi:cyclophilin family peptidyl-prolyl cis-trans isomerase
MQNKSPFTLTIVILFVALAGVGLYFSFSKKSDSPTSAVVPAETVKVADVTAPTATEPAVTQTENKTITNKKTMNQITLETSMGKIVFETYNSDAPKTVENFITLANKGFYNGVIFHRVIDGFMIQGGDPTGTGTGGPGYEFADELNPNTLSYKAGYKTGVVAMANAGPNTNGSQFFIMLQDYPLPNAYTIFGKVVSGQDVVSAIGKVKTDSGDKPLTPVVINKVTVE